MDYFQRPLGLLLLVCGGFLEPGLVPPLLSVKASPPPFEVTTQAVAAANGTTLVDLRRAYLAYLQNHNAELRAAGRLHFVSAGVLTCDGVQPSGKGNALPANLLSDAIVRARTLEKPTAVHVPLKPGAPFD